MEVLFIIFFIVVMAFSLFAITFVTVDIILEKYRKNAEPEPEPVAEPEPIPEPQPAPVVLPEIVEEISAEEADEILSDEDAMTFVLVEGDKPTVGYKTFINIGEIDKHFEAGETVTIEALKHKKLVISKAKRVKILADGILTKPLTIKAHSFSIQAIKMIELTGGTVIKKL